MNRRWMNILHAHFRNHTIVGSSSICVHFQHRFASFLTTVATSSEELATSQKYFAPVNEPVVFFQLKGLLDN